MLNCASLPPTSTVQYNLWTINSWHKFGTETSLLSNQLSCHFCCLWNVIRHYYLGLKYLGQVVPMQGWLIVHCNFSNLKQAKGFVTSIQTVSSFINIVILNPLRIRGRITWCLLTSKGWSHHRLKRVSGHWSGLVGVQCNCYYLQSGLILLLLGLPLHNLPASTWRTSYSLMYLLLAEPNLCIFYFVQLLLFDDLLRLGLRA